MAGAVDDLQRMARPSDDCTLHLANHFDLNDLLATIHGVIETCNQEAVGVYPARLLRCEGLTRTRLIQHKKRARCSAAGRSHEIGSRSLHFPSANSRFAWPLTANSRISRRRGVSSGISPVRRGMPVMVDLYDGGEEIVLAAYGFRTHIVRKPYGNSRTAGPQIALSSPLAGKVPPTKREEEYR